jgi:hypothetical protein
MKTQSTLLKLAFLLIGFNAFSQQIGTGFATTIPDFNVPLASGIYDGANANGVTPDTAHDWQHLFVSRHTYAANNHQLQISSSFANNDRLFFRKIASGNLSPASSTWNELATRGANTFNGNQIIAGSLSLGANSVNSNTTKLFLNNPAGKNWAFSSGLNNISENTFGIYNWTASQTAPVFSIADTGNVGIGTSYAANALTISKTAPSNSHIMFGDPSAIAGQASAKLTFAGLGIQHSGFSWIPGTTGDNGKLNLSFGGGNDPNGNAVGFTFQSNGNLGIGTTTPEGKLDINVNGNVPIFRGNGGYIPTGLRFIDDSYTQAGQVKEWSIWKGNTWAKGLGFNRYDAVNRCAGGICDLSLFLHDNGNVAIGNFITPTAQLHVKAPGSGTPFDAMIVDVASFNTGANAAASSYFKVRDIGAANYVPFIIKGDGKVGIGSVNPDEKLTVNGSIHAKEVRIDTSIPADYVFQKYYTGTSTLKADYVMPTLEEVAQYTKENNHLPNIPSAEQMQKEGVKLGEMNNLLLQKIEELTLYVIEQQKKLKELEAKVNKK